MMSERNRRIAYVMWLVIGCVVGLLLLSVVRARSSPRVLSAAQYQSTALVSGSMEPVPVLDAWTGTTIEASTFIRLQVVRDTKYNQWLGKCILATLQNEVVGGQNVTSWVALSQGNVYITFQRVNPDQIKAQLVSLGFETILQRRHGVFLARCKGKIQKAPC